MKQIIASVLVALPILLNAQQACEPTADLNQDGVVGISDLLNLLSAFGDTDLDFDGIYDSVDDCVGAYDECGVCNGDGAPPGYCDCSGNVTDALGNCGGDCISDNDGDGICDQFEGSCNGEQLNYFGYNYSIVEIAEQCWFAENLRSLKYSNGDTIEHGLNGDYWAETSNGATAVYGEGNAGCNTDAPNINACDTIASLQLYGRLYNWHAVNDVRGLCPSGWHVPTEEDFELMIEDLGGEYPAWWSLRTTYGWVNDNNGTNESGWGGLPGGFRSYNDHDDNLTAGYFAAAGSYGGWWTSAGNNESAFWYRLHDYYDGIPKLSWDSNNGFSVRCLKD